MNRHHELSGREKSFGKSAGKAYLGVLKVMGTLFLISLVLTAVAASTSGPNVAGLTLDAGETVYLSSFYADGDKEYQFAFGIEDEQVYQEYENTNGPWEGYQAFEESVGEWVLTMQVERSDSLNFAEYDTFVDISGEANAIQLQLPVGFYRVKMTNNADTSLDVWVGRAHANIGLFVAAAIFWAMFGVTVGIFSFMVHVGLWILFIYAIVKIVQMSQENNQMRQAYYNQQVIGPRVESQNNNQQM